MPLYTIVQTGMLDLPVRRTTRSEAEESAESRSAGLLSRTAAAAAAAAAASIITPLR